MKNHEIGSRLASSNLLHDKIVVGSELVSFFFFFKVHLHEISQFQLKENCKRKSSKSFSQKEEEMRGSCGKYCPRTATTEREVEIASLSLSLSLQDSNLIGHPSYIVVVYHYLPFQFFFFFFFLLELFFIYYLLL